MQIENVLAPAPSSALGEVFTTLLSGGKFRLERIVSNGQSTPIDQWLDQEENEWVVLLSGAARLQLADPHETHDLHPGDALNIPAHKRHRVEWTTPACETVWLALHYH